MLDERTRKNAETFENLPYHKFIGLKVADVGEGYGKLRVPVREEIYNANGAVHGGVYYTICDLAASAALWTLVSEGNFFVTNDINVSVLSSVREGELTVEARVLKIGKRLAFLEAHVFNGDGQLVAAGRVTKTILTRKNKTA